MSGFASTINLSTSNFRFDGTAGSRLGASVAFVGDVNGDGIADMLIGAPTASPGGVAQAGSSYLLFGKPGGWASGPISTAGAIRIDGAGASDNAGNRVAAAGDVNGDGFADFLIGVPFADNNGNNAGETWLVFGKAGGWANFSLNAAVSAGTAVRFVGSDGSQSGWAAANAGDVNGDGFPDFLIGAPFGNNGGEAWLVFGKAGGWTSLTLDPSLPDTTAVRFTGIGPNDFTGWSVAALGDVNGDRLPDFAIGAPFAAYNGVNSGSLFVVYGRGGAWTDTDLSGATRIDGLVGSQLGRSVSGVGDVNGDGYGDFVVGAPYEDSNGTGSGSAWLVFGKPGGIGNLTLSDATPSSTAVRLIGPGANANAGWAISAAGDVNGDGIADFAVTAPQAGLSGANAGATWVVYGRSGPWSNIILSGSPDPAVASVFLGANLNDQSGRSVSVGDANGDGRPDIAIGAPFAQGGGMQAGADWLLLNPRTDGIKYARSVDGVSDLVEAKPYSGPVVYLQYQYIGDNRGEALFGTFTNDFMNLGAGDDAANGGAGDDVLDGGTGSNFLTGGAGRDVFFLDARAGGSTWSTITDFEAGEQVSLFGWRPGVSRYIIVENDGTPGFTGATVHSDIDGDGFIDTSVTFTGKSSAEIPTPFQLDGLLWFVG
jgi:hypothetical protein